MKRTDHEWEAFGAQDPYYGVCTEDRYRQGKLDATAKAAFFESGAEHIRGVLATIRAHVEPSFAPRRALDFGCGVGRLVVPLASVAAEVVGLDISESMLAEARRNCEERGVRNVSFARSDDQLGAVTGTFDLVHSVIVFQHIAPQRGEQIIAGLLDRLAPGGATAIHLTYSPQHVRRRVISYVRDRVPLLKPLINLRAGRSYDAPEMRMYSYDLHRIFALLGEHGCSGSWIAQHDQPGRPGVMIFAKRDGR